MTSISLAQDDGVDDILQQLAQETLDRGRIVQPVNVVQLKRFKQYTDLELELSPKLTLMAGNNNAGKSSILHALAVWEFCKLATTMERGPDGLLPERVGVQGFGIGDNEFSPINIPSLKHMWTNLKPQKKEAGEDGYTLKIGLRWTTGVGLKRLLFGLSLANDRLFIRIEDSNLSKGDAVPRIAYLPPFAGISAHEEKVSGAVRRRRIGEGLAGAVLRNILLDMQQANLRKREELRPSGQPGQKTKLKEKDLTVLRATDPWEILQQSLREVFGAELAVSDFQEEYHSHIQVLVIKGTLHGHILKPHKDFTKRDLMVEGSGFLQWLSVFTLATSPDVDVLLLDEPDAHLHPQLQRELVNRLRALTTSTHRQVFIATHSSEILRNSYPESIMEFRSETNPRYLREEHQKVGLLEGIGAQYSPKFDRLRETKKVFFYEGKSDLIVLRAVGEALGSPISDEWVCWQTSQSHKERKLIWAALKEEISSLQALSLRDRDEEALATVGNDLHDKGQQKTPGFDMRKWRRRHIESYLLSPPVVARATNRTTESVEADLMTNYSLILNATYFDSQAPSTLLEIRGKDVLNTFGTNASAVAQHLNAEDVCEDLRTISAVLAT